MMRAMCKCAQFILNSVVECLNFWWSIHTFKLTSIYLIHKKITNILEEQVGG